MSKAADLLALAHAQPGVSRSSAATQLDMASGFAAETAARLASWELLSEGPGPPTGRPGRPTATLLPHPTGPLVAVAAIAHESWVVAAIELGGGTVAAAEERHDRDEDRVLDAVRAAWRSLQRRFGPRIQAWVVSVPGTVAGTRLVQAPNLGWEDVDLLVLRPPRARGALLVGNDATLAGIAEHRRGVAVGVGTTVHLYIDAGVGGSLIADGVPVLGATGSGGEFGHLPLGNAERRCTCGTRGCWNTTLDGAAIARSLGDPPPADPVTYTQTVLATAAAGGRPQKRAVRAVARSLGRGAAALVNALDPELVTVGGLGPLVLDLAGDATAAAYRRGLMAFRAGTPPPIVAGSLGTAGPMIGAAEDGFARVLTDDGIERWLATSGIG